MKTLYKDYIAKIDSKNRLTLRETPFEYYHVEHYDDGRIILEPRELVPPTEISAKTLGMIDQSAENLRSGNVSEPVDLSEFEE